jgi:hypothetical protein
VPHLRDGFIVAKVGIVCGSKRPLSTIGRHPQAKRHGLNRHHSERSATASTAVILSEALTASNPVILSEVEGPLYLLLPLLLSLLSHLS